MQNKIEPLEILLWIVMLILFYMILTRIFGHSATDIQIYLGFISGFLIIMGFFMRSNDNYNKLNREVGEIKISMTHSFQKIKEDINEIKNKL